MENRKQKKLAPSSQKSFKTCMKYFTFITIFFIQILFFLLTISALNGEIPVFVFVMAWFANLIIIAVILEKLFRYKKLLAKFQEQTNTANNQ